MDSRQLDQNRALDRIKPCQTLGRVICLYGPSKGIIGLTFCFSLKTHERLKRRVSYGKLEAKVELEKEEGGKVKIWATMGSPKVQRKRSCVRAKEITPRKQSF